MTRYIVKTFDNREYNIDSEDAMKLIEAWKDAERPFPVDLGGEAINSASIKTIEPRAVSELDTPELFRRQDEATKRLEAGTRCRGQYSIQKEINDIARQEGGRKWAKLIRDNKWREKTRLKLGETPAYWCDYRAGECACEADYISYKATFDRSLV